MIGSLRFAGDLSPYLGTLLALCVGAAVGWFYYRESRHLNAPYAVALPLLRALSVGLVVMILTGPVWHRRHIVGTLGRVTFALDASQSMAMTDSVSAGPNRLDRAANLLVGNQYQSGWIESLSKTHEVEIVRFADGEIGTVWSSEAKQLVPKALRMSADGKRTDLSSYLSRLLSETTLDAANEKDLSTTHAETHSRHAVVMVSDGRDNAGKSAVEIANQLGLAGIIVHGLGMGSADEPSDLGIVDVDHPNNVAADGSLAGRIILKKEGFDEQPIRLRIESDDKTVWQKDFSNNDVIGTSVPFQIDIASLLATKQKHQLRGVRRTSIILDFKATVERADGETLLENNEFAFRVGASIRNRQLLMLDGSSRWETRYLRNLFQRDPAWDVTSIIYGPGTDTPRVTRGNDAGQFPATEEAWSKYDAVILGEVPADQWSPSDTYQLREFVTRGGGLILIDGRHGQLKAISQDALADLVPVNFSDEQRRMQVRSIRPTSTGLDQSAMNLTGESTGLGELWEILPAPRESANVRELEGAEVWAHAIGTDGREAPWLVTRLFGSGRVVFVSSDESWRWRYKVADRFHARFWNQMLAVVTQPPYSAQDEFVSIGTDRIEYETGATPRVRVRLQNQEGEPVGDSTVDALFITENRVIATIPLMVEDPLRGTYEGFATPLPAGAYTIRVRASGFDEASFLANTPIWISDNHRVELNQVSLNVATMTSMATTSGGEYFHESRADELLSRLAPLSSGQVIESDILVWQSFYWFWLVIIVLAIEWWLRKKAGLA